MTHFHERLKSSIALVIRVSTARFKFHVPGRLGRQRRGLTAPPWMTPRTGGRVSAAASRES